MNKERLEGLLKHFDKKIEENLKENDNLNEIRDMILKKLKDKQNG